MCMQFNVSGEMLFENRASYFKHDVSDNFASLRKAVDKTRVRESVMVGGCVLKKEY